jgi:PAS domain S-box-containing protein
MDEKPERFRVLFQNTTDLISVVDADGSLCYASPSHQITLGYAPEELVGQRMFGFLHPHDLPVVQEHLARVLQEPEMTGQATFRFRHKDGTWRWLESTGRNLLHDPAVGGILASSRDITSRVEAEEQLRESELRFRAQYKGLPLPIYTWQMVGDDFELVDYNHAADQITSGGIARLLGARASELYADTPHILEEMWLCYRQRHSLRREMLYRFQSMPDARHLAVSYAFVPPDLILVHTEDITERVQAEEALRTLQEELEERVWARTTALRQANEALRQEIAERERAQREAEGSHQREEVLNALLRMSMQPVSLQEQLECALDQVLSVSWLPVQQTGAIFLVGEDPDLLELRCSRGLGPDFEAKCTRVEFGPCRLFTGPCLCAEAAKSGQAQFVARRDPRHSEGGPAMPPQSCYCVPIQAGEQVIGTILLHMVAGHERTLPEEEFLQAVAHTLAGIVERKRAEEALLESERQLRQMYGQMEDKVVVRTREIEQRRRVAESLRGMITVLNSDLPADEILEHIVAEASQLLGSDASAIYRSEGAGGAFCAQTIQGSSAEVITSVDLPPELSQILRRGEMVLVSDILAPPSDTPSPSFLEHLTASFRTLLAVPLIVKGEAYGGLVLYYTRPRTVSEEEADLAMAFADQAALAIENARLRQQAREAAVMEERARLARELHDSVTQALFSITLLAEAGQRLAGAGNLERVSSYLGRLGEMSQQSLKEMRLLVYELRPLALQRERLVGALQQRLDAVEARGGVEARLLVEGTIQVPAAVEEDLYRIAEQALNNALKHAAATKTVVHIRAGDGRLSVEVTDDGRGFDPAVAKDRGGQGLTSMQERAARIGGVLVVDSAPGQGTTVRVELEGLDRGRQEP